MNLSFYGGNWFSKCNTLPNNCMFQKDQHFGFLLGSYFIMPLKGKLIKNKKRMLSTLLGIKLHDTYQAAYLAAQHIMEVVQ